MAKCGDIVCYPCGQCGTEFSVVIGQHARRRYCSDACKQKAHREFKSLRFPEGYTPPCRVKPRQPKPCGYCTQITTRPRYCSVRCSILARDRRNGVVEFVPRPMQCPECSRSFQTRGMDQRYCTEACRKRVADRKRNHIRRVRTKVDATEVFDPLEVLARDGWRCHLCGVRTPKSKRGTHHDRAPELDHIVPLSAGGEHSRLNTACACRRCNIAKSDKPLGQLRLVA
jgi:hypothetical protein